MRRGRRSGKLIAILLALLTCLALTPWALNAEKASADATDPNTLWNTSGSWIARMASVCDITKVEVSGVSVDECVWANDTTCNVVLNSNTKSEGTFALNITKSGWSNSGVKINGSNNTGTSISHTVELSEGTASVTLQPYYSSITGTLKTFNFSVDGGGQPTLWDVTLNSGTGYTVSPVGDSVSPVNNKGSYTFKVDIAEGYKKGANFAVKVNGTAVELDSNNQYTISNITADQEVTVEDVVTSDTVNQYNITLTEAAGVTYTPIDGSASPVDEGNDYKFKVSLATGFIPSGSFAVNDNGTAMTADADDVYTLSNVNTHHTITVTGVMQLASVTAPTGSTVKAGYENGEWTYYWYDPVITDDQGDGTTIYWFNPVTSGKPFYRVQHPEGVTYWNFESMAAGKAYTVTMDDLTKNGSFASDTIYHDFYYNYLDLGDVYLTVNDRNCLDMGQNGTWNLNVFRNWDAINSFTNDMIALPDVHYEVVDINGNPSDLVTVTPDSSNSGKAQIKASSSETGMAVIKVTYDAMIHMDGYASGYGAGGADSTRLGAIWPECTGIIVVTVGQNGSAIPMGMTINTDLPMAHAGKVAGDKIDAEHDLLYYTGDEGAEFTFKPDPDAEVSIARCTLGDRDLGFNGFSTEGVTKDSDGNVTVTGLTAGRHIVKVEKAGVANYQVLSARQITIAAKDGDGNVIDDWQTRYFAPGDDVTFTLHNVNSPQEKLAQCYNNSFTVAYFGEDDKRLDYNNEGSHGYGQYNFSSMDQTAKAVIPENWTAKKTFLIKGGVAMAGFSGTAAGGHRTKAFGGASGGATGTAGAGILARLPELTLHVDAKPHVVEGLTNPVTKSVNTGETYSLNLSEVFTDDNGDALTYTVAIDDEDAVAADESYEFSSDEAGVYNLVFTANDGIYDSKDNYTVVLKVGQENTPPTLKEDVDATVTATIGQDGQYKVDLSEIFEDADNDYLSYKVSVNGADFAATAANYTYTPDAAGNVKLVFKANDGTIDSTDKYTVKLKVLDGVDPAVYWDNTKDGNGWVGRNENSCYVKTVSSSGVRTKGFEWTDNVTCNILLTSDTAADATFDFTVTNYASTNKRGVLINGNASAGTARTIQAQLENGATSITVQPWGGTSSTSYTGTLKTFNFSIAEAPANEAPALKNGVEAVAAQDLEVGDAYSVDLSNIFEDPNGDDLTYTVAVDDADPIAADEDYTFMPDGTGAVTLVFKANDGTVDSTDTYTVNLTVAAHVHDWGEPEWTWEEDFSAATAKFTCKKNAAHIEEKNATITSKKDSDGNRVYTAKATFNEETYTDTKTVTIEETTASVDFTSQMSGGFLHAPKFEYSVSSKKAETYGYSDDVDDGVSALDVLVAAHELVYGDDFTPATAEDYLTVSSSGSPNSQFCVDSSDYYGGFFLNHAMANNGTMYDDSNYNATTVGTQKVKDGDLVEFFFYEDPYWGDTYNWFVDSKDKYSRSFETCTGADLELTLKGFYAMSCSKFKDAEEMTTSDVPSEQGDVQIYTVNLSTGALTEIEDAVTDEDDGTVTLNFDEPGKYTVTAYGTEDCMFTQIMSLTTIEVSDHTWGEVNYEWAADNSKVTASRVCSKDSTHVETDEAAVTSEQTKAPTCEEKGETTYTSAAFKNSAFTAQTKTVADINALGHDWDEGVTTTEPGCENAGVMLFTCKHDPSHTKTEALDPKGHTWKDEPTIDTPETCTEDGEQSIHCAVCDAIDPATVETRPAKGHAWGEATYEWNADNSAVTASRVCGNDPAHVETEEAAATAEQTKAPTCEEKGETTYTSAAFKNSAFTAQTETVADIDAIGHAWGEWQVTKAATEQAEGIETRVCGNDATHTETRVIPKLVPDKAKSVKTVTINVKKVTKKAVDKAVKKAGGSKEYVTTIVLGKKVKKIKKGAFKKYKKATTLVVKTKKLKKKSVKKALKGSSIKTVKVKVGGKKANKKYVKKYKKIFKKKNVGKKVRVKR